MFVGGRGEDQIVSFRTNVDEIVSADEAHPLHVATDAETSEPSPYLRLRDGIDARLSRSVFYELVEHGVERCIDGRTTFGVWSCGSFFPLGALDAEPDDGGHDDAV